MCVPDADDPIVDEVNSYAGMVRSLFAVICGLWILNKVTKGQDQSSPTKFI